MVPVSRVLFHQIWKKKKQYLCYYTTYYNYTTLKQVGTRPEKVGPWEQMRVVFTSPSSVSFVPLPLGHTGSCDKRAQKTLKCLSDWLWRWFHDPIRNCDSGAETLSSALNQNKVWNFRCCTLIYLENAQRGEQEFVVSSLQACVGLRCGLAL